MGMIRREFLAVTVALASALAAFAVEPAAAQETLFDAMANAYTTNPTLQAERSRLKSIDEGVSQALSGWRPTVSLGGSAGWQNQDINNTGSNSDVPKSVKLSISQPIYLGGRTIAQTASAEANVRAGRAQLISVEQSVLLGVVTAYMDVLRDQAVIELNRNNEQVLRRQLEAARDRFRVGEITRTDVAQAEARLSRATADRVQAEGLLVSSRASYGRVVGRTPGALSPPPPLPPLPTGEEDAIAIAQSENPDMQSSKFAEEASRADVKAAIGSLYPSVSLEASYSHAKDQSSTITETDTAKILASVSVPLYQSGGAYSRVRQAKQVNNERRIRIEEARRQVVEGVTQAWENLSTARARITSRREQVRASEIALDGVMQEAAVGSRTTLDILDAEQELLDARVELVRAERDEYVSAFAVQAAIGRLTAERLKLPVAPYDPTRNYRIVRDKLFGSDVQ